MSCVVEIPAAIESIDKPTMLGRSSVLARFRAVAMHPAIALTLLTALGGALRFWRLDQPALWGDEVATFRRVCGTFQQLVDQLAVGGFTPLHYLLYYWIKLHTPLTPWMMRLPPAIFGTLLVPAIYFLARQLVRPPVALLAAAFTACSAYQLNFARDAKMYADLWLCGTLHMACFLWWLRTRSGIAWWGWVAAGAAMMGVQFVGAAVYPIELLIVLSSPRGYWRDHGPLLQFVIELTFAILAVPMTVLESFITGGRPSRASFRVLWHALRDSIAHTLRWRRRVFTSFKWPTLVLFLLGLCVAGAAPYTYYVKFNRFFSDVYNDGGDNLRWQRTGIGWVNGYNEGRDGLDLIRYSATAYSLGWEWPKTKQWVAVNERTGKLLIGASAALALFAILGVLPLTRRRAWSRRRSLLWIALWLVLPAYAFYCASMSNASSPLTWIEQLLLKSAPAVKWPALPIGASWAATWESWRHTPVLRYFFIAVRDGFLQVRGGFVRQNLNFVSILILSVGVIAWIAATVRMRRRSLFIAAQTVLTIVGIFLLCVVLRMAIAQPFPRSVWMPRYLGFVWPAFAILLAVLFYRLPTRPIRWLGIAILLGANLSVHAARVLGGTEPPTELMARDIVDSQPPLHSRLFSAVLPGTMDGAEPGTGVLQSVEARYYLAILAGKAVEPKDIRNRDWENQFLIGQKSLFSSVESQVVKAVSDPSVEQIIVWQQLQPKEVDLTDSVEKVLPANWRKASEQTFAARDHWTWTDYYVFRRRVYLKR